MRENGTIIKQMAEESSGMRMEMFMKANGKMIKLMVLEFISM